ncbi:PrpR N-terminal domain-containing protein [Paenibacillus sp. BR2-3]|uniref:PrpR N-terminal domain-containing protein n=1 Tax=Paenibacillus sp. BR2-3 TaxID=3048494 RepID=UPI0039778F77
MRMKIKVLVIAPYTGLVELTTSLKEDLGDFDITVLQSDLSEVLPMIGYWEKEGYDLMISRGGTAKLLRKHSSLPIVEIPVSGYDILRMLVLVKDYKVKMELIGFPNIIDGFVSVSSIMNINIPFSVTQNENEVNDALVRARDNGVKVVLGDNSTVGKAAQYGIQGILITSGKESVLEAFAQAKHIHQLAQSYYAINETYESLIDFLDEGIAVIDNKGMFQFANSAFLKMFKLPPPEPKDRSLFDTFPFFKRMVEDMNHGMVYDDRVTLMDPGMKFSIVGGKINYSHNKEHYYIKVSEARSNDSELTVIYWDDHFDSYPPLLAEARDADGKVVNPGLGGFEFPLTLFGEKGSGTRLFAGAVRRGNSGQLIELNISSVSDSSFDAIRGLLNNLADHTIIYIHGIENAELSFQKALYKVLLECPVKVMFAFEKEPRTLADSGALERQLYDKLKNNTVFSPPLRERLQDLEGLVRSFIIQYNVRFGKQIVGVRPEVLSALSSHNWTGNLLELQETIRQFVKDTDGEYIEEDVLPIPMKKLPNPKSGVENAEGNKINLNQTLDEIERDIIRTVLEEEQMNQTRAAKRLGINRSTLWRKIKQGEE